LTNARTKVRGLYQRFGTIKQFVVMDSGFDSADALDLLRHWGFEHVSFGGKSNLRLRDGRQLKDVQCGECIELDSLPGVKLYASWVTLPRAGRLKKFYVLDTLPGLGRTLTRRHKRRWLIESFFKSAKYDFGLNEIRLCSETGTHNWLFLVWLSLTLALFMQGKAGMTTRKHASWAWTLSEAASWARDLLMPHWSALSAQIQLAQLHFRQTLSQLAYLENSA
ncbi:transposase, partial [Deinococcus saxicola]|uniref:transposase n=2 Tax=Deinococcus saxicola TaxID=249406 RepID=UPI003D1423F4